MALPRPDAFTPPDCLACGACCCSPAAHYVPVTGDDWTRLGDEADRWVTWTDNRAYMRMVDGHCAALIIETDADGPAYTCQVYEQRPQICRDLARGSPTCEAALWQRSCS